MKKEEDKEYKKVEDFEIFPFKKASNAEHNSGAYATTKHNVSFWISSFQSRCNHYSHEDSSKKRIYFDMYFHTDPTISGTIDDLLVTINDGETVNLGEVDPEELYYAGCAFKRIAEYFGVTKESLDKDWEEEHKDFN